MAEETENSQGHPRGEYRGGGGVSAVVGMTAYVKMSRATHFVGTADLPQ
jgi:hypothetical protein